MGKSLYNIHHEYLELAADLEEAEGVLTPELEERLKIHEEDVEDRVTSYHKLLLQLKSEVSSADDEIKRIEAIKTSKEKALKNIKDTMLNALQTFGVRDKKGIKRLEYTNLKLSVRRTPVVQIFNEDIIPDKYLKTDVTNLTKEQYTSLVDSFPELTDTGKEKIAKKEISDAIKNEEVVDGAAIGTSYSLIIR